MAKKRKVIPAVVTRDAWNGYPLLRFEGSFRPFRLSPMKCEAVLSHIEEVRAFAEEHRDTAAKLNPKAPGLEPELAHPATPEELAIIAKYVDNPHSLG